MSAFLGQSTVKLFLSVVRTLLGVSLVSNTVVVFTDRLLGCSCEEEGVWSGNFRVLALLYADDVFMVSGAMSFSVPKSRFEF